LLHRLELRTARHLPSLRLLKAVRPESRLATGTCSSSHHSGQKMEHMQFSRPGQLTTKTVGASFWTMQPAKPRWSGTSAMMPGWEGPAHRRSDGCLTIGTYTLSPRGTDSRISTRYR